MRKAFKPKIVTSNHLLDGDAIYLTGTGGWSRCFADALVFEAKDEADRALAGADAQRDVHVGAYLADAELDADGTPRPAHFRERFRATGPSVYRHGKQAEA